MEKVPLSLRDELINRLKKLIDNTERIFLSFAERFPKLIKEMDKGLSHSSALVDGFQSNEISAAAENHISAVIDNTREIIEEGSKRFAELHEHDEQLFSGLDRGIERLSALEELIGRIKEDSIEMELISLNAMTVALKAGNAGKAFSYITEELQRLSATTISLTEDITTRGGHLLEVFHKFRSSVRQVRDFQAKLFNDFKERLTSSFDEFNQGVDRVVQTLRSISEKSAAIKVPLNKIMEEIQLQDIIKQSVDHVIISLGEYEEVIQAEDDDKLLDELAFFQSLPDLGKALLTDIRANIEQSLAVFQENTREAETLMKNVEQQRLDFLSSSIVSAEQGESSLNELFEASTSMLQNLLNDLEESVRMKQEITANSQLLMKDVHYLEDNFKSFANLINRFHSIDVASRIEVAKQDVLRQMSDTVEEMTELTAGIDNDVNTSLDATKEFIKTTNNTIGEFRSIYAEEEVFVKEFTKNIKSAYDSLFDAKNELTNSISNFSLFTNQFFDLFQSTAPELENLKILIDDIDSIIEKLSEIKKQTADKMEPLLASKGLSEWHIENEKLKSIINRFTIFTHKKTAGDIGGFEVEEGAESGEITFF